MSYLLSLKELVNTLYWARDLLVEMFEKRKSFAYKYDDAAAIMGEDKLEILISKQLLRRNGPYVEIDDQFQQFFEQVLEVNEEINTSYINENIQQVKQHIIYYLQENNEHRRYSYLKQVKSSLRKIGRITLRNVIDLNRNIENTFKTEPNYSIKISKLESLDEKRRAVYNLIEQTDHLITDEELTFFTTAMDEELKQVVALLRGQLTESRHNLIETQKQVIEYLNQVKYHSRVQEKIKQVKYLKDQFELKAKTNLAELMQQKNDVVFESRPAYPLKLSLDLLHTDEGNQSVRKVADKLKQAKRPAMAVAESIASDDLLPQTEEEIYIDLEEIRNGFTASGRHLYNYIMQYNYPREVSYEEKITIFCQMVSMYEQDFVIKESYQDDGTVEYAVVLPR
ncbi:hypothetical protein JMG10_06860 [Nostoc ellipsosporum NOK]|jgi:hypothetical protein|nr:hypothetical protein [Nostoc ellipsosporum NOK]